MTVQQLRDKNWIIFECISGSHSYGTNIEGSDTDIRGIFVLPTEEVLAERYMEQINDKKNDIVFYEVGRFLDLLYTANPNILELLNTPEDCIIYKNKVFDEWFPDPSIYLTKKLKNSFVGYAHSQIEKAKGLNKKINWDKSKTQRKDIIDFCKIVDREDGNIYQMKKWLSEMDYTQDQIGLSSIDGFRDCYRVYTDEIKWAIDNHRFDNVDFTDRGYNGIIKDDSNEPRTSIIEKYRINDWKGVLYWNREAYSTHCKDYSSYVKWLSERNEQRYLDNLKGEQGYDHKNMMHCMRLLFTAQDIVDKKQIIVKRPERDYLLKIRNGEITYKNLLDSAESKVETIKQLFKSSDLPEELDIKHKQELLLKIRNYDLQMVKKNFR